MRRAVCAVALLWLAACGDPFDPASRVTHNRVLGALAEVEGDPTRAWPRPGETLTVTWLVVDEGAARPLSWLFAWCPAAPTLFGEPFCVEGVEPTVLPPRTEPGEGPPVASIDVPEGDALFGADEVLLMGLICAEGSLAFAGGLPEDLEDLPDLCDGEDARATPVLLSVPLQLGDATNHRPGIAAVRLGGAEWPEPPAAVLTAPAEGCPEETPAVPRWIAPAEPGPALPVEVEVTGDSHETYTVQTPSGDEVTRTESLRIQHVATAGELARLFSVLDADTETHARVDWEPPDPDDRVASEQLVRFHFVVTDGRAGATFASRALCWVDPPE